MLETDILPQLCKDKPDNYIFRVWVTGCATGEEAYSIAILLRELIAEAHQEFKVQIYSTDLDADAISTARAGFYRPSESRCHPGQYLDGLTGRLLPFTDTL